MSTLRIQPSPSAPRPASARQYRGVDALRALAALAVVLLHACVPYLRTPMPGLLWPVTDSPSVLADPLFWGIEVFVMPVFLAMAGFFLWRSAGSRSPKELLGSRARRLLIPLVFGILVVLPVDLYVWTLGLVSEGIVSPVKLKSLKFEPDIADQIWGLSHLWFLQYVFLYVTVTCVCLHRGWLTPTANREKRWTVRLAGPVCLLLVACSSLWVAPEVVWGFQHSFFPVATKFIYSGAFFAFGWWLAGNEEIIQQSTRHWRRLAGLSAVALLATVSLGLWFLQTDSEQSIPMQAKTCLVVGTVIAATLVTFTSMTLALGGPALKKPSSSTGQTSSHRTAQAVGFLSAGSFWVYLVHHPLLGLIHLDLKWLFPNLPPTVKLLAAFTLTCVLSLAAYEFLVRRTRLGRWLGFSETPGTTKVSSDREDRLPISLPIGPATDVPRRKAA